MLQEGEGKKVSEPATIEINEVNKKALDIFDTLLLSKDKKEVEEIDEISDALALIAAITTQGRTTNPMLYQSLFPTVWEAIALGYLLGRRMQS